MNHLGARPPRGCASSGGMESESAGPGSFMTRSPAEFCRGALGRLLQDHQILAPERKPVQPPLGTPARSQSAGKVEMERGPLPVAAGGFTQPARFARPERDGVAIERNARHDPAGAGIERVVLPKKPAAAGPQQPQDVSRRSEAFGGRNVMEHAVAVDRVDGVRQRCGRGRVGRQPLHRTTRVPAAGFGQRSGGGGRARPGAGGLITARRTGSVSPVPQP
jgi:hypothetical protein